MSYIVTIHSFRRGTGKTTMAINLAASLAIAGYRVALIDTDFQAPSLHLLLGMEREQIRHSLNDYLWGNCDIGAAVYHLTPQLRLATDVPGQLYFLSTSPAQDEIERMQRGGYFLNLIGDGFQQISDDLDLDVILLDVPAGVTEDTLFFIAIANRLLVMLHADQQDYQGTAIITDLAQRLEVPAVQIVANEIPASYDAAQVESQILANYVCDQAAVLHFSDEMMGLANNGIFVLRYPDHPLSHTLRQIALNVIRPIEE